MEIQDDELKKLWDREHEKYIHRSKKMAAFPLKKKFLPNKGDKILDAGCGVGNYMAMFSEISNHIYGVDISKKMVEYAMSYGNGLICDLRKLPLKNNEFDFVFSLLVMNHFTKWEIGFSEMARVLKEEGRMVIVIPNLWSFVTVLRKSAILLNKYSLRVCLHFTVREINNIIQKYDLVLCDQDSFTRKPDSGKSLQNKVSYLAFLLDKLFNKIFCFWGECLVLEFKKNKGAPKGTFGAP